MAADFEVGNGFEHFAYARGYAAESLTYGIRFFAISLNKSVMMSLFCQVTIY